MTHKSLPYILFLLYSGIANEKMKLYGVQFHPEVDLTENGCQMIKNFLYEAAKCQGTFTMLNREKSCINYIREVVGKHTVLVSWFTCTFTCTLLVQKSDESVILILINVYGLSDVGKWRCGFHSLCCIITQSSPRRSGDCVTH